MTYERTMVGKRLPPKPVDPVKRGALLLEFDALRVREQQVREELRNILDRKKDIREDIHSIDFQEDK